MRQHNGRALRSEISPDGELKLFVETVPAREPGEGEILVRIDAAPINPSDLGLMFGPADPATLRAGEHGGAACLIADVSAAGLAFAGGRLGRAMPLGNEGAGVVVAAGTGAEALVGRRVAAYGGAMYADYRTLSAKDALVLPDGVDAASAASCFVNPMTALGMVETMRGEGHQGLVHTAAASNLGRMLTRICLEDAVPLVNIVRRPDQVSELKDLGAVHVLDSSAPDFADALVEAIAATNATLAFDAVGGGRLGSTILTAMERSLSRSASAWSRYGSATHKQLYIYGGLDIAPTQLSRSFGMAWSVGGWLLPLFLQKVGPEVEARMKARVVSGLTTTFASRYVAEIGLEETLKPDVAALYLKKATGEKYLIRPDADRAWGTD